MQIISTLYNIVLYQLYNMYIIAIFMQKNYILLYL